MHLGAFTYPGGHHIAGWRHGSVQPLDILGYDYYRRTAQAAERGKFDLVFVGDMLAAREKDGRVIAQGALNNIDSISILSAVAGATERVGLVATLSTTYNEPFAIAQRFASIDHLSGGRAGWNIITTANDDAALNFSRKSHMEKTMRYQRAREFVDICKGLWDGWKDGAVTADRTSGTFVDSSKVRELDHKGQFFVVKGALDLPRSPQGWPVMVQAGGSPAGLEFAATVAELIFAAQSNRQEAIKFRAAVKQRMPGHGRDPAILKVLPGLLPILGSTEQEALEEGAMLNELLHPAVGIWMLSEQMQFRLYDYPQDGPLPTASDAGGGAFTRVTHLMERADREACRCAIAASWSPPAIAAPSSARPSACRPHDAVARRRRSTASTSCRRISRQKWTCSSTRSCRSCSGAGCSAADYEGTTLRHHLGLPIPCSSGR
jgi:FMN-dependent oxidoreductase (nitrilotriacetate monooxygenase family)